jgi:hypothetical protein
MKDLNKFLKSILLFVPFLIIVYSLFIVISLNLPFKLLKSNINYEKGSYGHLYSRLNEIKNYENVDILFLGSSRSYRGFDTRIYEQYGLKCFNLGSSGQTFIQTNVLLKRYLKQLNPKIIIFEVSPLNFSSDGVESSIDLIANDKNDLHTLKELIKWDNIKTINTAIYGFYDDVFIRKDFVEVRKKETDLYIPGGFVEKELMYYEAKKYENEEVIIKDNQLEAFKKCINIINANKIELKLVQAPITGSRYKSYSNIEEFDRLISSYGEYYNFNKLLELKDSIHFYDSDHLNQNGVVIFNQELIKKLVKLKK